MATINASSLSKLNNYCRKNMVILKGKMAEPTEEEMTSLSVDGDAHEGGSTEYLS